MSGNHPETHGQDHAIEADVPASRRTLLAGLLGLPLLALSSGPSEAFDLGRSIGRGVGGFVRGVQEGVGSATGRRGRNTGSRRRPSGGGSRSARRDGSAPSGGGGAPAPRPGGGSGSGGGFRD